MTVPLIRPADAADGPFLARGILESDRGHVGVGTWDFMLPMSDAERLEVIGALVVAQERSYVHWSTFLVADLRGEVAGCVASYVPDEFPDEGFTRACLGVLGPKGWDEQRLRDSLDGARSRDYFSARTPGDAVCLEWVYTDPGHRGRGVSAALVAALIGRVVTRGAVDVYVATYIGNAPAISLYQKAGFSVFAECRHADYERRFVAPGLVYLRRASPSSQSTGSSARAEGPTHEARGQAKIVTGVPSGRVPTSSSMSSFVRRMQPALTSVPMTEGSLVPWMPITP